MSNANGFGYLRASGGNAFLSVGPKNSNVTDGKRKPNEASSSYQSHTPKASEHENGPKQVGLATEEVLQAELRNIGQFSNGLSSSLAHSPSVKGKKVSTSKLSYGVNQRWDLEFQFITLARDEVGHESRGNDHRDPEGSCVGILCEAQ
nr:hypothetical protein CFP56_70818 [Quercus suber]